jgi:hypothetical protein
VGKSLLPDGATSLVSDALAEVQARIEAGYESGAPRTSSATIRLSRMGLHLREGRLFEVISAAANMDEEVDAAFL